jgi:hypothetical protein
MQILSMVAFAGNNGCSAQNSAQDMAQGYMAQGDMA